ncbi:MAG: Mu-like prophage major head subunit gpT family protein [Clostridiales bacterium]|nr:Mu-like prophage major head subunit gpT family protein [Clostridiales bacterium]
MAGITFTFASGLNDSIFGKNVAPIKKFIEKSGEAFEQESMVNKIFEMGTDNAFGYTLTTMTAMNGFQPVGELGAHPTDHMQEGYKKFIEHMTWKDRFSISREAVDDAKLMDLKQKPAAFIAAYHRTRERFGAALLGAGIKGQTSMSFMGKAFDAAAADKQALFSTSHPLLIKKTNKSNCYSNALNKNTFAAMETEMQNFVGDNGEILDVVPDTIIIPNLYSLKQTLFEIIGADKEPDTANNGFNYLFGRWNVIVWPYLNDFITGGTAPSIMMASKCNEEHGGAVWRDRVNLEVKSYIDHDTDANVWDGYSRFSAGFNDWRAFAVGGVSGGTDLGTDDT